MAPPSKLNKGLIDAICILLADGNYFKTSCEAMGICKASGFNWLKKGEELANKWAEEADKDENTPQPESLYFQFYMAVKKAQAQSEVADIAYIKAGKDSWQSRAWLQERKNFDRWGRKDRHEVSGKDGGAIALNIEVVSDKAKQALEDIAGNSNKT